MDDDRLSLSALNHFLYCQRRCALIRIEGLWSDNAYTVSGILAHENADDPGYRQYLDSAGSPLRIERALPLFCQKLNLIGKADIVEFHADPGGGSAIPLPVDYKLGRRRKWDNDDVQLCAQAICLEEMFNVGVPQGAVYHVATRRRRLVPFTPELRELTIGTIEAVRVLLAAGNVPLAELKPQCEGCSMHFTCMPELTNSRASLDRHYQQLFAVNFSDSQPEL
ncbi:MAG TPA: CRISPR-associated protein Cas4 [Tepidisphaeraceae bacterium]|jgi:CRISPR-associated exonuclease Cas4